MCTIGILDSGIGGISTLKSIMSCCKKQHRYVYYMDDKNCPYGVKSESEIKQLLEEGCSFLQSAGADIIVVACNTATAVGIDEARRIFDVPLVGIEPSIKQAFGKKLLLATPLTLKQKRIKNLCSDIEDCTMRSADNLANVIQNNLLNLKAVEPMIDEILWDGAEFDSIILGCTHYIFMRNYIADKFPYVKIVDGNDGVARRTAQLCNSFYFDKKGFFIHCTKSGGESYLPFITDYLEGKCPEFI